MKPTPFTVYATEAEIPPHMAPYYVEAPADYGGGWWPRTPFTGPEPWVKYYSPPVQAEVLPEGFVSAFGPRPTRKTHPDYHEHRLAKLEWEDELAGFKQLGFPPGVTEADIAGPNQAFQEWQMGSVLFYEGKYGWRAIFPNAVIAGFTATPSTAVQFPHLVIAQHQIRMLQRGMFPDKMHPWVPPGITVIE